MNVMLAGAGDALLHPDWPAAVELARKAGCVGLATYGLSLDAATIERILQTPPDVLQVYADAVSDAAYATAKRGGSATAVWAAMEALAARRTEAAADRPMIVPTMLKTPTTLSEQAEFFDRSLMKFGWGLIVEPTAAAGQWPDHCASTWPRPGGRRAGGWPVG